MNKKIIRTICIFTRIPSAEHLARLDSLAGRFTGQGFVVQTKRLCAPDPAALLQFDEACDGTTYLSMGTLNFETASRFLPGFLAAKNVAFNLDLTDAVISPKHIDLLTEIIHSRAAKTFSFAFTFNNAPGSPYFPSAMYREDGFAVGLQPTDLSSGCRTLAEWLAKLKITWFEVADLLRTEPDYLGIDTSIAPLSDGNGSFFNFIGRVAGPVDRAVTSDAFLRVSSFIKAEGPKKTGLCGLMFPCLEDFDLADLYERGGFSIERNVFLSLHSGLGIDTYPIGIDEDPARILEILRLVQGLSNKYRKPLSVRFISDGTSKIGDQAAFKDSKLKDVIIRSL